MKHFTDNFRVSSSKDFSLKNYDTAYTVGQKKEDAADQLHSLIKETAALQTELYAARQHAVLIIFQAMDAGGKDSAIAHTMSGLNPQGCEVHSFKQPTTEEYEHDFLWRHYKALPPRGKIGIHNRSHYENVLVTKVHPKLILKENLPGINNIKKVDAKFWKERYHAIREFEQYLYNNGTVILKFFLHVSKEEQKERFLKRIDDPEKNWKFSADDIKERKYWNDYMKAYERAIRETATPHNPWYIIPADKKWFTRIAVSSIILETFKDLRLKYPVLPKPEAQTLQQMKAMLESE